MFGTLRAFMPWLAALSTLLRESNFPGGVSTLNNIVSSLLDFIIAVQDPVVCLIFTLFCSLTTIRSPRIFLKPLPFCSNQSPSQFGQVTSPHSRRSNNYWKRRTYAQIRSAWRSRSSFTWRCHSSFCCLSRTWQKMRRLVGTLIRSSFC